VLRWFSVSMEFAVNVHSAVSVLQCFGDDDDDDDDETWIYIAHRHKISNALTCLYSVLTF